ncbi:acyl-CoA thioesterase [Sulfobacillus harzensis]|uniref:Acyl-CoA thioesterase n=1 Tax=Sulfobacillus harzensis TaxID=2729629 RepID=A0A7Y0Q272_9FIRM|nr:thioesterase family protein [Sulfobacillus harzensis]NMP22878.1 acyl-CoA thioesterase [Sulfobacillus harzensis]
MHTTSLRVRFGETDMAGHVNNAVYLSYLEEARIQFLREALHLDGMPLILASARLDFISQVFFPDQITIESGVSRFGRSSFDIVHRLYREPDHQLALEGLATVVYFDYQQQKPAPFPEEWRDQLQPYWTSAPAARA